MSNKITASTPGKIVLSGEYAVLDGAAAICMALNRRARAVVADCAGEMSEVSAVSYTHQIGRFESLQSGIRWHEGQAEFGVLDSVWRAVDLGRMSAKKIELDSGEFIDSATQRKIGIGSSAAITVALCAAISNTDEVAALTAVAQRAHTSLQGNAGSGVDVACSLSGGLIEYRMQETSVTTLQWPEGLLYRVIWTGVDVSTRDKLARRDARVSKPSRVRLASASESMANAWRNGDAAQVITAYTDYIGQLRQFSADHKLGIFDAGHDELCRAARTAGLTYKPCGAGGGDVGIVFGLDDAALDEFVSTQPAHCSLLDCEISPEGVRIDR